MQTTNAERFVSGPHPEAPSPRKVLHVLNSASGGAALSTLSIVQGLQKRGVASVAVCHDTGTRDEREALREAFGGAVLFTPLYWWNRKVRAAAWLRPAIEIRNLLKTGFVWQSTHRLLAFCEQHRPDLVHTNTIVTPEGALAARHFGLPHVWHVRERVGAGNHCVLPAWISPLLAGRLGDLASVFVANSRATAQSIERLVPSDRLRVVWNGLDLSAFRVRSRGEQRGRVVVGQVAGLGSRGKKHALFVRAAARVSREVSVEFRIYGQPGKPGDAYTREIEALIDDLGLRDRFRIMGYVNDPAAIMDELDVLVHTMDGDAFGRIFIEAMAAAVPIAACRGPGPSEVVADGEAGLLSPADDAEALAHNIERLVREPSLRDQIGRAGRSRAERFFSVERYVEEVGEVYAFAMQHPLTRGALLDRVFA